MNFNQRVGRALYRSRLARCAQQAAHQCRLARAEVAFEPDDHAARKAGRKRGTQGEGGGFVGQG